VPRAVFCLGDLAGEVGAGWWMVAGLDDRDPIEGGVELAVAAAVDAVAAGCLARAAGDWCGAAEASEGSAVAEAADVAGVGDHRGRDLRAGTVQIGDWVAVLDQPVTEADAFQAAQLALACQVDDASFADRVDPIPIGGDAQHVASAIYSYYKPAVQPSFPAQLVGRNGLVPASFVRARSVTLGTRALTDAFGVLELRGRLDRKQSAIYGDPPLGDDPAWRRGWWNRRSRRLKFAVDVAEPGAVDRDVAVWDGRRSDGRLRERRRNACPFAFDERIPGAIDRDRT
jgi:hypothetical protein